MNVVVETTTLEEESIVNKQICPYCEASSTEPNDNLHCVGDGAPHSWHTCGDIFTDVPGSDCPKDAA